MEAKEIIKEIKQDFAKHEEKHKQLEEMAKIIELGCGDVEECTACKYNNEEPFICCCKRCAEKIYNLFYPKDSVVLSRKEYEKLKQPNIKCNIEDIREAVFDITSCVIGYESAEKLYKKCFPNNTEQLIKENRPSYNEGYFDGSKETAEKIIEDMKNYLVANSIPEMFSDDEFIITASLDECYGKLNELAKQYVITQSNRKPTEKHKYHVTYVNSKKQLLTFDVEAADWKELQYTITKQLPTDAEYICAITYNKWTSRWQD